MPEIRKYPTARVIGSLSDAYVTAPNVFFSCRVSGQGTSIWDSLVIRYTAQSQEKAHDAYVSWLTHVLLEGHGPNHKHLTPHVPLPSFLCLANDPHLFVWSSAKHRNC